MCAAPKGVVSLFGLFYFSSVGLKRDTSSLLSLNPQGNSKPLSNPHEKESHFWSAEVIYQRHTFGSVWVAKWVPKPRRRKILFDNLFINCLGVRQ